VAQLLSEQQIKRLKARYQPQHGSTLEWARRGNRGRNLGDWENAEQNPKPSLRAGRPA